MKGGHSYFFMGNAAATAFFRLLNFNGLTSMSNNNYTFFSAAPVVAYGSRFFFFVVRRSVGRSRSLFSSFLSTPTKTAVGFLFLGRAMHRHAGGGGEKETA